MPNIVKPISVATDTHDKLDPRLAALLELDDRVFEPVDAEPQAVADEPPKEGSLRGGFEGAWERSRGAARARERRSGPLAFLRGIRPNVAVPSGEEGHRSGHEAARFSRAPVFVTARSPGALDSVALKAGGIEWRSRAGQMATADVDIRVLQELEGHADVLAIEWTGGAKPLGSPGDRRGVAPRRAVGLDGDTALFDGSGVVIGVVDIEGIDIYHPDFSTAGGTPRILAIWDQTVKVPPGKLGRVPAPYGYGVVYTRTDLWVELDPNRRERYEHVAHTPLKVSHGTMVAAVAAGGGVEDSSARGVAPGADVVFVDTRASGAGALAAMTEIAEAVDFVFRTAGDRPCVVNVSLGDDLGAHDGTSPVERFFDELLKEKAGRAVVIAAGNSNGSPVHATAAVPAGGTATLVCTALRPSRRHAVVEIWYDEALAGERGIAVSILSPGRHLSTPRIPTDGRARAFDLGGTRLIVASTKRYPESDNALLRIEMFPAAGDGSMDVGQYRITLTGDERARTVHAWLDHPFFELRAEAPAAEAPRPITLTSPGTCKGAVTVGACDDATGAQASFGGCGPGRGGVDKPDVLACGVALRTASAATLNRTHAAFTGTSAAAPLVTGALALAFQYAARRGVSLTAEQTRRLVRAAADLHAAPVGASAAEGLSPPARGVPPRFMLRPDAAFDEVLAAAGIALPPEAVPGGR
jgi:hypothetical protein